MASRQHAWVLATTTAAVAGFALLAATITTTVTAQDEPPPTPTQPTSDAPAAPAAPAVPAASTTHTVPETTSSQAEKTYDVALANRRAYERISQALAKPAEFAFEKASLAEVAARLERDLGVPVRIDRREITNAGIGEEDLKITFAKTPVSARSALDMILHEANLAWTVKHETLWITTPDVVDATLETRVYDISQRDEFGEYVYENLEALIEVITSQVAPQTWDWVGGSGSIKEYSTTDLFVLVITQTQPVHEQIEQLLAKLEAARHPMTPNAHGGVNRPPRRTSDDDDPQPSSQPADANRDAVVRGANELAFDLYRDFTKENDKNCFFSPHSIATALAMVRAGATGETGDEITTALHLRDADADMHAGFGSLRGALRGDIDRRGYELRVANRLWTQTNLPIEAPFLNTLREQYGSETGGVDFIARPDAARRAINAWVADQTSDRIRELMPPHAINDSTRAVLVNAVYFNAKWTHDFADYDTKPLPFNAIDGRRRVPTMSLEEELPYAEVDGVQAVALEYGSPKLDGRAKMIVLLPRQTDGALDALEESLSADYVEKIVGQLKSQRVKLYFPKFTFADTFDLREHLANLGIRRAFDVERAEFDGITKAEPLFLSAAVHQAFIRVDGKGTEAAAATAIGGALGGEPTPPKRVVFRADHPFVFLIFDSKTRSILFLGRVMSPPEETGS